MNPRLSSIIATMPGLSADDLLKAPAKRLVTDLACADQARGGITAIFVHGGVKGFGKVLGPAKGIRRRFAAVGSPLQADVKTIVLPGRVSEHSAAGYPPATGDGGKGCTFVISAAHLVAADQARRR